MGRSRAPKRLWLAFSLLVVGLPLAAAEKALVPEYQVGEQADADVVTPVRLLVPNPVQLEQIRELESQQAVAVFRFYPQAAADAEAGLRAAFRRQRAQFLALMEQAAKRSRLDEPTVNHPSFARFVDWFQSQHPAFPLGRGLARAWALGEPDESFLAEPVAQLRQAMDRYVRDDSLPPGWGLGPAQVRLISVKATNAAVSWKTLEQRGFEVGKTNLVELSHLRRELIESYPEEPAAAKFLAGFVQANCFYDEALTREGRDKALAAMWKEQRYAPGEVIVRAGQTVDARAKAALDLLRSTLAEQERREALARARWDKAQDLVAQGCQQTLDVLTALAEVVRRYPREVVGVPVLVLLIVWLWRHRKRLASPQSSATADAGGACTVVLGPARDETLFLPATQTVEPNLYVSRLPPANLPAAGPDTELVPDEPWPERILAAERRAEELMALVRAGLAPHLASHLMSQFVRELLAQREQMVHAQQRAAREVEQIEARFGRVYARLQEQLKTYEQRTAELEKALAAKTAENRELIQASMAMAKARAETVPPTNPPA